MNKRDLLAMACLTQDQVYQACGSFTVSGAEPGVEGESDE